jgi:ABC-type ATPase with predicted acetyltransferase domain
VCVIDTDYIVDAKLPLLWRVFEGKIEKMIKEQASAMLPQ